MFVSYLYFYIETTIQNEEPAANYSPTQISEYNLSLLGGKVTVIINTLHHHYFTILCVCREMEEENVMMIKIKKQQPTL